MNPTYKFFSLFIAFSILSFGVPSMQHQAMAGQAASPYYLEIHEDNIDSFPVDGHIEGSETLDPPFWVENGKIFFDANLAQAINNGEAKQNYNLLIAPAKFDEKSVKLLVKHLIHYEGKGRNTETAHYYMFDAWPAVIPFEPMNVDRADINLDENEGKLLNIRLTEESLLVDFDQLRGELRCKYGKIVSELPKDRAWEISEKSKKISVSREVTVPKQQMKDPKGEGGAPETTRHEFGEVEFKTKLTLKNLGSFTVA